MGAEDDATYGGDGGFTNVEALFDDGRAQHEQAGEAAEDDVYQVRLGDGQVLPRHVEEPERSGLVLPGEMSVVYGRNEWVDVMWEK